MVFQLLKPVFRHARSIHAKLKDSGIYKPDGSRRQHLKKLSASVIESQPTQLGDIEGDIPCTHCEARFTSANGLIIHLTGALVVPASEDVAAAADR